MKEPSQNDFPSEDAMDQAAAWMWRLDRGLTGAEQDAFFDWLARSPENVEQLARQRFDWKRLDQLSAWRPEHSARPNPDLLAPSPVPMYRRPIAIALAAAAALALSVAAWNWNPIGPSATETAVATALKPEKRNLLEDGSTVKLHEDAEISIRFSDTERRVFLIRGEAFFIVSKDPVRPFIVDVQGVSVRAVGTAFNVRQNANEIEVLVAEGIVQVGAPSPRGAEGASQPNRIEARQRAIVSTGAEPYLQIDTLSKGEIKRVLAWQHGLMTFSGKPVSEIVEELNQLNEIQLTISDAELASLRFSGTFRSDNVEGFARLLEAGFGASSKRIGESEIELGKDSL